jgi:hypothetical protein
VKPYTNSVEVHPQLNNNRHPMDDLLVGVGSLWPMKCRALRSHCENLCSDLHQCNVFFYLQNFTNFLFEKYDFDLLKRFFMKTITKFVRF